jgi:tetratricopeptide (TPR) repeat protein
LLILYVMDMDTEGISTADLLEARELIARGDYENAVALLERMVADDPTETDALTALGIAFTESSRNDKAIKALLRSLQLREDDAAAHEAVGCAYFRLKAFASAEFHLQRARVLSPDDGGILRNLGVVLNNRGDWSGGTKLIERACELNQWDYQAIYALASVRLRQGEIAQAIALLERVATEQAPMDLQVLAMDHVKNLKRYLKA